MNTKERIITIRLLERLMKHPAYGKIFGIECVNPGEIIYSKEEMPPKEEINR